THRSIRNDDLAPYDPGWLKRACRHSHSCQRTCYRWATLTGGLLTGRTALSTGRGMAASDTRRVTSSQLVPPVTCSTATTRWDTRLQRVRPDLSSLCAWQSCCPGAGCFAVSVCVVRS